MYNLAIQTAMNKFTKLLFAMVLLCCISCEDSNDTTKTFEAKQETYSLPGDQLFPEGIAYNPNKGMFYVGSTMNGDVVQVNVENGESSLFSSGAGQSRTDVRGIKTDAQNRLWLCGGQENKIHVLDPNGHLIRTWDTFALFKSGFINDCVTDGSFIYFTDSRVQKIYRTQVNTDAPGQMEEWLSFTDQQIPYGAGFNANGAALSSDGKYLLIVISNTGKLYRIDTASKAITEIQLNAALTSGDGLWLDDKTLYVSRNANGQIFSVVLNENFTQGTVGTGFGQNLKFNTTIAKVEDYLLVLNSQLNLRPSSTNPNPALPNLPFTVSRVAIP
ncbi:hypothetical protein AAE02nite_12740 [Adhaeribacter aerolatus]|uniref:SMP-30/Gluconolactonase/LRE-like region domain-containing protein n=1 Tax=Adhaeribacter aerolatus TaxID=670289 RepID=A0A512AV91_9BACT|nr:SMP-30/gluconolactonase/LRE family protein [Adhaeribacter aerolatus]GEO03610.1 hypothetical protein AAE02nite_12740 [Adhaeribacter aerolatus]